MGPVFLNARLQLYLSCTTQSILFNLEGWYKLTNKEINKLESIQAMCLCSLLSIPKTTPYIGLLNELGIWSIEKQLIYKKIMFYHNMLSSDDRRLSKRMVLEQELGDDTDSFYMDVKEKAFFIGLSLDTIKISSKKELKVILKKLINKSMVKTVTESLNMSKLRFVNRPETFSRKKYILEMNGFAAIQVI